MMFWLLVIGLVSSTLALKWCRWLSDKADRLPASVLKYVSSDLDMTAWESSRSDRYRIYPLLGIGLIIIVLVPLGLLPVIFRHWGVQDWFAVRLCSSYECRPYELWEIGIVEWTLMYLIFFTAPSVVRDSTREDLGNLSSFYLGVFSFIGLCAVSVGIVYLILATEGAVLRLTAEVMVAALLVTVDIVFIVLHRPLDRTSARLYGRCLCIADGPTLVSLLVLLAYVGLLAPSVTYSLPSQTVGPRQVVEWKTQFVAGAGALNLLLVNVIFSSLYIWQKYVDARAGKRETA